MLITLASIWLVHMAGLLTPGANTLLVTHLAVNGQFRNAVYAVAGVAAGTALWACAAVLGIKAIFETFPTLRLTLQLAGGCYLLFIAYRLWSVGADKAVTIAKPSSARSFRLGLLTNITNPKAASLPASPSPLLLTSVVVLVTLNSFLWNVLLAFLFSRGRLQVAYAGKKQLLGRVASVVMSGLGLSLVVASVREARS